MKKKNPGIAFLLGLLPLFQAGMGILGMGPAYGESVGGILLLLILLLGFSWGWGYVYLGHVLRAVAAFFSGAVINFSLIFISLRTLEEGFSLPQNEWRWNPFLEDYFFPVILAVMGLAAIWLAIDAARLALRHNRMVREKQPGK